MITPTENSASSVLPLQVLHKIDRRAESTIEKALKTELGSISPETFAKLRRIKQIHPETKADLDALLQQFGSLTLGSADESVSIHQKLAIETSPFFKSWASGRIGDSKKPITLAEFAPATIRLLVRLLEHQKVTETELLENAGELIALGEQLQIEEVTLALAMAIKQLDTLTASDYRELLTQAKSHSNFILYFNLLCHAATDTSCKETLTTEELEIVNHPAFENITASICFKNISIMPCIDIHLNSLDAVNLYIKMRSLQLQRSSIEKPFTASITQIRRKPSLVLSAAKKAFEEFGWPSKAECHISDLKLFTTFFTAPKHTEHLEALAFTSCEIGDQLISFLPKNIQLKELVLEKCNLTNHSAQALQHYLSTFTTLTSFSLENNTYSAVGIPFILQGLSYHRKLSYLVLSKNNLDGQGLEALNDLSVSRLDLSVNPLGDAGIKHLTNILSKPHQIEHLDLTNCAITDKGVEALCDVLCENPLLYSLDLSTNIPVSKTEIIPHPNTFTSEATPSLCKLIENSVTLTHLDLSGCKLTADDLSILAESVKKNTQLEKLTLGKTEVSDEVALALADMLRKNTTLLYLCVFSTKITDRGAKALVEAVADKESFQLSLTSNNLSAEYKAELKQNPHIHSLT